MSIHLRTRAIAGLIALLGTILLTSQPAAATRDPVSCSGYPEPRAYASAQTWWANPSQSAAHAHIEACIPDQRATVSGTVPFDLKLVLHNQPTTAKWTYVSVVTKGVAYETTVRKYPLNWTCQQHDCERWLHVDLPVSLFQDAGLQEIRFRGFIPQNDGKGNEMRVSMNFQAHVDNGKTPRDVKRLPYYRAKGWYTGMGYCEASYRSDLVPIPTSPVAGRWSPSVWMLDHGSTDVDPTHHLVALDSDFHFDNPGLALVDGPGPFAGRVDVDTRTLADGTHKFVTKTDCANSKGTVSGVGYIVFTSKQ
jgi:hypothetical protein